MAPTAPGRTPVQPEARRRPRETAYADTQEGCEELKDWYVADLQAMDQHSALKTFGSWGDKGFG